jgi:4-hydroxy-3-methylbut-2-enyl diphosphate reductase
MKQTIQIDPGAGPCFGVQRAISIAEDYLQVQKDLACLGDLIHNDEEIRRLEKNGLRIVSHCQIVEQSGMKMLVRAHGEPPSTFRIANTYDVEVLDATCPIVKQLQKQVEEACQRMLCLKGQVILFGDINHPEMIALKGYCKGEFHIVRDVLDIETIDLNKPSVCFSQTTKYQSDYHKIVEAFKQKQSKGESVKYSLEVVDTVCKHVAKRDLQMIDFLSDKDVLIFVSGRKSSNGKILFDISRKEVKKAYFISNPDELKKIWFKSAKHIAISGATSTPLWLLNKTYARIEELLS